MTGTTSSTVDDSDDLRTLLPAPTRRRNLALVAAAIAVVALAWVSPTLLRPTPGAVDQGSVHIMSGGASGVTALDQVAVSMALDPRSLGPLEVVAVDDLAGAEVLGAWVVPDAVAADSPLVRWAATEPDQPFEGQEGALPQPVPGTSTALDVLWQITDCDLLDPAEGVRVTVRTAYGLTSTATIDPTWSPGGMRAEDWIDDGVCP